MKRRFQYLVLLLTISLGIAGLPSKTQVRATSNVHETIQQKKEEIDKAKKEREKLKSGLSDVKKLVQQLEKSKDSLKNYVLELDGQLTDMIEKIEELKVLIREKEQEIEETRIELEEAIATEKKQYEEMKIRIKFMYEKGDQFYLDMLIGASSFGDMINKAGYVEAISAYDRQKLNEYEENRMLIEVIKEQLEEEEAALKEAKAVVEKEQENLEALIDTKNKEITAYENDIATQEEAIAEYEEYIREQDEMIASLEKALKEMEGSNRTYDGGVFKWPAPSYTRISDYFGWRHHPILNRQQFHNGVDMAAPGGSPILAAYDGTVVAAGYSGTMGNYIYLNHGSGLVTIYMHASALYVSTGQEVSKGDKIAAVGTTGRSTGNHLHFGVRLNGSYVDPMAYFK